MFWQDGDVNQNQNRQNNEGCITREVLEIHQKFFTSLSAVSYKIENYPNLKSYLELNPEVSGKLWSLPSIIIRMDNDPHLMSQMDADPKAKIYALLQPGPLSSSAVKAACCVIIWILILLSNYSNYLIYWLKFNQLETSLRKLKFCSKRLNAVNFK